MAEYIDRKAFVKAVKDIPMWGSVAVMFADSIPAADVAPVVHGQWKYYHKQNKAVCTRCSFERDLDENFGAAISCPNCAAMMDGGEDR